MPSATVLIFELVGDADDRLDDLPVGVVIKEVTDELKVDLEVVDGEVLEIGEGSVADAEVIQREGAAEVAQPRGEHAGGVEVVSDGGLGDLEDEILGWAAAGEHGSFDPVDLDGIGHRPGRQVDLDTMTGCGMLDRLIDHPLVNDADEPEPLGGREELAGGYEAAAGHRPAHPDQQFGLLDLPGGEVDDRLA